MGLYLNESGVLTPIAGRGDLTAIRSEMSYLGAKNFINNTSISETDGKVQYTVNPDKSISINILSALSANAGRIVGYVNVEAGVTYILTGGVSNKVRIDLRNSNYSMWTDNAQSKEVTSPKQSYSVDTFTPNNDATLMVYIRIDSSTPTGNAGTVYPMLHLASDPDNTYQPYAKTNQQLTVDKMSYADNGVLGAKNLLTYPYTDTTKTVNGITFTDNADGTITVSGTATANVAFTLQMCPDFGNKLPLILSGCPVGGSFNSGYRLQYANYTDMTDIVVDAGEGALITKQFNYTTYPNSRISIEVRNGTVLSTPITFKPMLRLATDPDSTYQPYAKTNRELTKDTEDTGWITVASANITNMASGTIKYRIKNGYCTISVENVKPTDASAHINVSNIPKADAVVGGALCNSGNYQTDGWIAANTVYRINANSTNTAGRYGSLTYPID